MSSAASPSGVLFVVATPIGNMDDISHRAVSVLAGVQLVAAEDTRRSGQLLARLGLRVPLLALHEHNEAERSEALLARLGQGESIALVSDAGTPLISDPGYRLVAAARERGFTVTPIPGACAAIAALSVAGLPTDRFHFEGFLPARASARRARIGELQHGPHTLVFYESVHRMDDTLQDLIAILGERKASLARELSKLHETIYWGTLDSVRGQLARDAGGRQGEFTLVVAGAPERQQEEGELARVVQLLLAELPASQAARLAAKLTGAPRRAAYELALRKTPES